MTNQEKRIIGFGLATALGASILYGGIIYYFENNNVQAELEKQHQYCNGLLDRANNNNDIKDFIYNLEIVEGPYKSRTCRQIIDGYKTNNLQR